jgi:apolipoprotein N-acyltransferase
MTIRAPRVVITAVVMEILAVAALILIPTTLLFWGGIATAANAEADLQRYGSWVGPIAGFLFCLLGGWWVARPLDSDQEWNGVALGLLVTTLDVALLTYAGAPFAWVFVLSTAGRIVAGYLGGELARKRRTKQNPRSESFRVSSEA